MVECSAKCELSHTNTIENKFNCIHIYIYIYLYIEMLCKEFLQQITVIFRIHVLGKKGAIQKVTTMLATGTDDPSLLLAPLLVLGW